MVGREPGMVTSRGITGEMRVSTVPLHSPLIIWIPRWKLVTTISSTYLWGRGSEESTLLTPRTRCHRESKRVTLIRGQQESSLTQPLSGINRGKRMKEYRGEGRITKDPGVRVIW